MQNKLLEGYLKMKGLHHNNLGEYFAEIMTETRGNILQELMKEGFKEIRELEQFLFKNQKGDLTWLK